MRKNDPVQVKENLLQATRALVLTQGIKTTTIDQICRKANVSKGAFFHHFSSKKEALAQAIEASFQRRMAAFEGIQGEKPFLQYLTRLKAGLKKEAVKGCMLACTTNDFHNSDPEIMSLVCSKFESWLDKLTDLLESRKKATLFLASFEGAIVLAKAQGRPEIVLDILDQYAEKELRDESF